MRWKLTIQWLLLGFLSVLLMGCPFVKKADNGLGEVSQDGLDPEQVLAQAQAIENVGCKDTKERSLVPIRSDGESTQLTQATHASGSSYVFVSTDSGISGTSVTGGVGGSCGGIFSALSSLNITISAGGSCAVVPSLTGFYIAELVSGVISIAAESGAYTINGIHFPATGVTFFLGTAAGSSYTVTFTVWNGASSFTVTLVATRLVGGSVSLVLTVA